MRGAFEEITCEEWGGLRKVTSKSGKSFTYKQTGTTHSGAKVSREAFQKGKNRVVDKNG